ncbi:MAG: TIR domain-containing protein [Anaerolineales bacterium]
MAKVFISYRRSDSREISIRMAAELKEYFGANTIFFDQSTIIPGAKWPQEIQDALSNVEIVLIVIGPQWLHAKDEKSGRRRIDVPGDWVREEVSMSLKRKTKGERITIIPVLFGNIQMPDAKDLNDELSELSTYQGIKLLDTRGHHDFDELKEQLIKLKLQPKILQPVATPRVGKSPAQINDDDERKFLSEYKEWEIVENEEHNAPGGFRRELHRVYEFPTFELAFEYMNEVTKLGINQINHHPRWENTFNRLEVWLTTFNIGYKPSVRDIKLAKIFEEIWLEYKNRIWEKKL